MANELLTRDDVVRAKQNVDAHDKYLDGAANETVRLPSGKVIKTRAGVEKELLDKFPSTKAGLRNVGLNDGDVMEVGSFGLGASYDFPLRLSDSSTRTQFFSSSFEEVPNEWGVSEGVGGIIVNRGSRPVALFFGNRAELKISHYNSNGWTNPVEVYHNRSSVIYSTTTATAANVVVSSTGELHRSTSSRLFKTDINEIEIPDYRAALRAVQPISYRSTSATADRTDWHWYSFIAEDLANVDPALVNMSSVEFFEDTDEDGNTFINTRQLPEGEYVPDGLNLNGIVTLMARINQYMLEDIEDLEKEKTQLKTRMTKLENRLTELEKGLQAN